MNSTEAGSVFPARGFYAILDTGYVLAKDWETKAQALLDGGAILLQVRAKAASTEQVRSLAEAIHPLCQAAGVPLIINDHAEVALALQGAGLHIGQDDLTPVEARELLGPDRIIGWSTHSLKQAAAAIQHAEVLNYFAVGPVFPTGTKPDYKAVGLDLVRQVRALNPPLPFFAIGGIKRANMREVMTAGATGLVVVSEVLQAADTRAATAEFAGALQFRGNA